METLQKGSKGDGVKVLQKALHLIEDGMFGTITEEAVKTFQKANGLCPDGVVGEKTWGKLLFINGLVKSKRNIMEIIVHCSATPDGKDFTVDDIRKWHKARGFSDVGYHYIVYRDGSVHDGRSVHLVGAHCTNHNANSIGVCYIGGVATDGKTPKDTRTPQQKEALLTLLKQLKSLYPQAKIYGHRNFANKACPSFAASREYQNI